MSDPNNDRPAPARTRKTIKTAPAGTRLSRSTGTFSSGAAVANSRRNRASLWCPANSAAPKSSRDLGKARGSPAGILLRQRPHRLRQRRRSVGSEFTNIGHRSRLMGGEFAQRVARREGGPARQQLPEQAAERVNLRGRCLGIARADQFGSGSFVGFRRDVAAQEQSALERLRRCPRRRERPVRSPSAGRSATESGRADRPAIRVRQVRRRADARSARRHRRETGRGGSSSSRQLGPAACRLRTMRSLPC